MAFNKRDLRILQTIVCPNDSSVLTLGRQDNRIDNSGGYSEKFFAQWGASSVSSLDASKEDEPTYRLDLNLPITGIPQFDMVWDGGTLEHCFNIPEALQNVKRLIKPSGIFLSSQLAGITGHGFYTLSPELLWRWSLLNGFRNQRLVTYSPILGWKWDLSISHKRMTFRSIFHTYFWFYCRKSSDVQENVFPKQSLVNGKDSWL